MSEHASLAGVDVLVTGGAGFVGSHLVRRLLAERARVTVLEQPGAPLGALDAVRTGLNRIEADLTEPDALQRSLAGSKAEVVFHLAAWTGGRSRAGDPEAWRLSSRVNLEGTLHLLTALAPRASAMKRIVRTGGMEEYGDGPVPFREDQREQAVSPYSASQVAATQAAHAYAAHLGLPLVTLRPSLIYGPGQDPSFFLPALMLACLAGRDFEMTSGVQTVDFVFVEDVVDALVRAATSEAAVGQVVNAGSGREISLRALAERVVALSGTTTRLHLGKRPDRAGEAGRRFMDVSKAQRVLGWSAATPLDDGLRRTLEGFRAGTAPGP